MYIDDVFKVAGAMLTSIGGAVVIVVACSTWLGKIWANRILEKDKLKYTAELEAIKSGLQRESERQRVTFSLYFEGQFRLYNDLWVSLSDLQSDVDALWESATQANLRSFVRSVDKAERKIKSSALLIEKAHYESILQVLAQFKSYKTGKEALIRGRNIDELTHQEVIDIVERNRNARQQISSFTSHMLENMRQQIRGE